MKIATNIIYFLCAFSKMLWFFCANKLIWVRENPKFDFIFKYSVLYMQLNNQKFTPNFKELNLVGII